MNIDVLIIISCICMLFVIGKIFIVPIKWILKLVFNSIFGGVLIWIINLIGGCWGFHIGLNIYTSMLVRIFRNTRCNFFNIIKDIYRLKKPPPIGVVRMVGSEKNNVCFPERINFLLCRTFDQKINVNVDVVQNFVQDFTIVPVVTYQIVAVDKISTHGVNGHNMKLIRFVIESHKDSGPAAGIGDTVVFVHSSTILSNLL